MMIYSKDVENVVVHLILIYIKQYWAIVSSFICLNNQKMVHGLKKTKPFTVYDHCM